MNLLCILYQIWFFNRRVCDAEDFLFFNILIVSSTLCISISIIVPLTILTLASWKIVPWSFLIDLILEKLVDCFFFHFFRPPHIGHVPFFSEVLISTLFVLTKSRRRWNLNSNTERKTRRKKMDMKTENRNVGKNHGEDCWKTKKIRGGD